MQIFVTFDTRKGYRTYNVIDQYGDLVVDAFKDADDCQKWLNENCVMTSELMGVMK